MCSLLCIKYHVFIIIELKLPQNAGNGISVTLDLKMFPGVCPGPT